MGREFRVNTYQNNWQQDSHVLVLKGGGFLVTWSSYLNEYDDTDVSATYVAAQFYDANGAAVGQETMLRGINGGYSGTPASTQLKNGNIVVTWAETPDDDIFTNGAHIRAQIYNTSGQAVSDIINVDTVKSFEAQAPDVVATGKGGFVISFGAESSGKKFDQVYYRSYDAEGEAIGKDKLLNTKSGKFDELVTDSAELTNGKSVIIWNSEAAIKDGTDNGQNQIRASLFNENGKVIKSDFGLTEHFGGAGGFWSDNENYGYAVTDAKGGGFAVANLNWTKNKNDDGAMAINFSAYNSQGKQIIDEIEVFKKGIVVDDVDIARLSNGKYVVAWSQQSLKNSDVGDDAYGLILSAKGKPIGKVFTVGEDITKYDDQSDVSVAALKKGNYVITYTSESIDADNDGIAATFYGKAGREGNREADAFVFADAPAEAVHDPAVMDSWAI
ncbi:hypothetical protein [Rhizobium sp.]